MYIRYKKLEKYINGIATGEYMASEEMYDDKKYPSYDSCMSGVIPDEDYSGEKIKNHPYYNEYFTVDDITKNDVIIFNDFVPKDKLYYNLNNSGWIKYSSAISVKTGDKVSFKNTADNVYNSTKSIFANLPAKTIYGNLNSMYAGDNFKTDIRVYQYLYRQWFDSLNEIVDASNLVLPATTLANYCYYHLFWYCTSLEKTPVLPAMELAEGCYDSIFDHCTSLKETPVLPATKLARSCYRYMFSYCTSLKEVPVLSAMELARECYGYMFINCTALVNAPELPATALAQDCYKNMFQNCTSLTKAPELPATTLADSCYYLMFYGCTSLTKAPELTATNLKYRCYYGMFNRCKNLKEAPVLPATTIVSECYSTMFYYCERLNYIKCLAETGINVNDSTKEWVVWTNEKGTFVKKKGVEWELNDDGIPEFWNIIEEE